MMGRGILRQRDANSCLSCSLLFLVNIITGIEFTKEDEERLSIGSFGKCRESYVLSHLLALLDIFSEVAITLVVDNEDYRGYLKGLIGDRIQLKASLVNLDLLEAEVSRGPFVILVDRYFLDYEIHIPHYVVVEGQESDGCFTIADPWRGEIILVRPNQLQEAIFGARHILWWAPTIIRVE